MPKSRTAFLTPEERRASKIAHMNRIRLSRGTTSLKYPSKGKITYTLRNSKLGILAEAEGQYKISRVNRVTIWYLWGYDSAVRRAKYRKNWSLQLPSLPWSKSPKAIFYKKVSGSRSWELFTGSGFINL